MSNGGSNAGIGIFGAMTVLFVGLKLTEVIDWSWWWVLAPSWIPLATLAVVVGVMGLIVAMVEDGG